MNSLKTHDQLNQESIITNQEDSVQLPDTTDWIMEKEVHHPVKRNFNVETEKRQQSAIGEKNNSEVLEYRFPHPSDFCLVIENNGTTMKNTLNLVERMLIW